MALGITYLDGFTKDLSLSREPKSQSFVTSMVKNQMSYENLGALVAYTCTSSSFLMET